MKCNISCASSRFRMGMDHCAPLWIRRLLLQVERDADVRHAQRGGLFPDSKSTRPPATSSSRPVAVTRHHTSARVASPCGHLVEEGRSSRARVSRWRFSELKAPSNTQSVRPAVGWRSLPVLVSCWPVAARVQRRSRSQCSYATCDPNQAVH